MGLLLYKMKFPLRYNCENESIIDDNNEEISLLKYGCNADMEYLVIAANEKYTRDNAITEFFFKKKTPKYGIRL